LECQGIFIINDKLDLIAGAIKSAILNIMAKMKLSGPANYELLYIIPNKFTEEEAGAINKKVSDIITNHKGNISASEYWGKKRLAYPINNNNHGYYNLIEFSLERENLAEINQVLRMSNEVLRHQIVKKEIKTVAQIEEDKKIASKIASRQAKKENEVKEKEKAKDEKKLELKDLDAKLDKILETDDLL